VARHARIVIPGLPHLVMQSGHNGQTVVMDTHDAQRWLDIVRDVAATQRVLLHAWRLAQDRYLLLATPPSESSLSRLIQDLGRRYVTAFNTRHGRSGTLWEGRFRSTVVQPGLWERQALLWLENPAPPGPGLCTREHHLGQAELHGVVDPKAYWSLGNTPFERQAAWSRLLDSGLAAAAEAALVQALRGGRPLGDVPWQDGLQALTPVPLRRRPRGRPHKAGRATETLNR